ncbi:MAG: SusC/RagA family TonB-linked outer membrane protein, partial [Runella slithyformis]
MKKQFTKFLLLFLVSTTAVAQNVNLKGKITDVKGAALVGVGVQIKGTKQATVTDNEGGFAIQNNPKLPLTLQLSYLGFETKEIVVNSLDFLTIALQESANELSEVVVSSGYTIQNKSEFSGAVSSVSAKQLQNRPAVSFDQLLGGQAPGIDIIQPSGALNATPVLRVRGINTITSGLFPLVVVDGVTVFVGAIGGGIGNNPLSDINPNDI